MRPGTLEIVFCTLVWGTIGSIVKDLDVSAPVIVFFRLALGALIVGSYAVARGRWADVRHGARRTLLIGSGLTLAVHWTLMFEAFDRLDVASAILIVFFGPVLVAAAAPRVLGERRSLAAAAALVVAMAGIVLIASPTVDLDVVGLLAAGGSAVLFAVLVLIGKKLTVTHEPIVIAAWQLVIAAIAMSPFLLGADWGAVQRGAPTLLLLGVVYTGALSIVFFRGVRALPAQTLSVLFYLEPASAVLYAWWFLSEVPSVSTVSGGALIVAAGLAIIMIDRRTLPPVEVM
jgi:drug/metabolite transporter (DMT)-like permease